MNDILLQIIKKNMLTDVSITPMSKLREDLGLSSFSMFMIVIELEEKLDIIFDYDSLSKVQVLDDLNRIVEGKING